MTNDNPFGNRSNRNGGRNDRRSDRDEERRNDPTPNRYVAYWYTEGIKIHGHDEKNAEVEPAEVTVKQLRHYIEESTDKYLSLYNGRDACYMTWQGKELIVTARVGLNLGCIGQDLYQSHRSLVEKAANPFGAAKATTVREKVAKTAKTRKTTVTPVAVTAADQF